MSIVPILLKAYEDAWSHDEESLDGALCGVASDEASWQHPAYAREPGFPGLPVPGTILWHVAHLEHCARHYAAILEERPVTEEPKTPPPRSASLSELLADLREARTILIGQIGALCDEDLSTPCARGMDVGEFVRMVIRHETWHAGQIAVIRRLYRAGAV
jgi:hypothetical protein